MHTEKKHELNFNSVLIHGAEELNETSSLIAPVFLTSTFKSPNSEEIAFRGNDPRNDAFYSRYGNPTINQAASLIARIEKAEACLLTASGMAAITTSLLSLLRQGDHVVAQHIHYGSAKELLRDILPDFGVEVTFVDQSNNEEFAGAIKANTKVIYCESPSNPVLKITDLKFISLLAQRHNITTIVDSTLASPFNTQPILFGIDLVIHSATKYLSGHSDLTAGAICSSKTLIDQIWRKLIVFGGIGSPFDAWLIMRGLKTFGLRMERHNATGLAIAKFLSTHPMVEKVYYPGLENPQLKLARDQMTGFGGVVSFELKCDKQDSEIFLQNLSLPKLAPSLGSIESLIVCPVGMLSQSISESEFLAADVSPKLIRLSVGLEDKEDLIYDLDYALSKINSSQ